MNNTRVHPPAVSRSTPVSWHVTKRLLALALLLLALFGPAKSLRANTAGGIVPGFTTPVTTGQDGQGNTWMDNGILRATMNNSGGVIVSIKYLKPGLTGTPLANGVEMVSQSGGIGSSFGGHTNIYYSSPDPITFGPCTFSYATPPTVDLVDAAFTKIYDGNKSPWDTVVHFVLRKGSTGVYSYLEEKHPASYGAAQNGFTTLLWPSAHDSTNFLLENVYIDNAGTGTLDNRGKPESRRHGLSPSIADGNTTTEGSGGTTKETLLIKNPGSVFDGFVDCKYSYEGDMWKLGCWGRASDINKLGGWFVIGSPESMNNGVTVNDYLQGWGLVYLPFATGHSGNAPATYVAAGQEFNKVFGPFFMYINSQNTGSLCWSDAQVQATAEQAAWPYSWLTYNPLYQTSTHRATVTGKIAISDAVVSNVSGGGAWVGLADPDDGAKTLIHTAAFKDYNNWQYQNAKYQYWVKADANGNFTFPAVATTDTYGHPASYALYAFTGENSTGNGAMGEFQSSVFSVTAGQTLNLGTLTWQVPHKGAGLVFQIGKPDRKANEFQFGNQIFQPAVWKDYASGNQKWYPDGTNTALQCVFSNPIEYDTSTNDPSKLCYAQVKFNGVEWKWNLNFNLTSVPTSGNYWLNIAYAGHGTTIRDGNWNENTGAQKVYVNGTAFSFNTVGHVTPGFYPDNDSGDILIRYNDHGKYAVSHVPIPANMLHAGTNTITVSQEKWSQSIFYDCITLETPPLVDDGVYTLDIESNGTSLYTMGLNAAGDTSVKVYTYNAASANAALDQWELINLGGTARTLVMFKNLATGKYLTGGGGSTVTQAAYDGSANQIWQMQADGSTAYLIRCTGQGYTAADGHVLTQPYTSGASTVSLVGANGGAPGQAWRLIPATPVLTTDPAVAAVQGDQFYYEVTADNNPTSFSATGLPPGLTLNTSTGLIAGKATAAGTYTVTVSATNAGGTTSQTLTLTVQPPVPAAPTGLTGFGWDGQVDLRWTPSANAASYTVTRSTSATGTYTVVGSNVATPYFSDTAGLVNGTTYYYQISASDVSGTSGTSAALDVATVPSGDNAWSAGDIGAVSQTGSASYSGGSYTVSGSGADIFGTADAFQFMSQPLTGDGAIVARVASVSNTNPSAKAGVMIRASLAANAANAAIFVSPPSASQGVTAQWRLTTGAATGYSFVNGATAPYWVKLARAGNVFTSYTSADGVAWTLQSTQTISMTGPVYVGLAVGAHNNAALCTATFDSVGILPAAAAWQADDIGSPAIDGFTAYSGSVLTLNASGADIWGTSDQLRYVYQPASGDCNITVRVTGVENSNHDSKGGLMLRETLAANSPQVDLVMTPDAGVYMQARTSAGAATNNVAINNAPLPPCWLRLARVGNTVTGYTSPDGSAWTTLGSTTVTMGASTYLGVAATSHDASELGTATLDNISCNP